MTSLLDRGRLGENLSDHHIIDMHCHIGHPGHPIPDASAESLVKVMDRLGVERCFCSHLRCLSHLFVEGNDRMLEAMRAWPDRIMGYLILWPSDAEAVRAETERRIGEGFTGIKLHSANGFAYDDDAYEPAYAIAHERRLPVLFHTWGKKEEFDQIGKMAERYPDATYILGHAGSVNEDDYISMARDFESVYLELCLSYCPRGLVERLVSAAGAERIIWGSDAAFINMPQQLGKVLGAGVSEADKLIVLSENAKRVISRIQGAST